MLAAIENGILDRLRKASDAGALGYRLGTLETYPQDWDERLISSEVRFPAAWSTFVSFDAVAQMLSGAKVTATFGLVLAAKSIRNKTAARHGVDGLQGEPGSMQLMTDAIALLMGQTLGLEITGLELQAGQAPVLSDALVKASLSLMATQWRATFMFDAAPVPFDQPLDDFQTFAARWDVPPFRDDDIDLETQLTLPIQEPQQEPQT